MNKSRANKNTQPHAIFPFPHTDECPPSQCMPLEKYSDAVTLSRRVCERVGSRCVYGVRWNTSTRKYGLAFLCICRSFCFSRFFALSVFRQLWFRFIAVEVVIVFVVCRVAPACLEACALWLDDVGSVFLNYRFEVFGVFVVFNVFDVVSGFCYLLLWTFLIPRCIL